MALKRRDFLIFLGATAGTVTLSSLPQTKLTGTKAIATETNNLVIAENSASGNIGFKPIQMAMPLDQEMPEATQMEIYSTYEVQDDLVLPEGFTYEVIAKWGDPLGDSRFGYNNDYLSFIETAPNEGYLTVNFEYISGKTWRESYEKVIGKKLPFDDPALTLASSKEEPINAFALPEGDPLKETIKLISKEGLIDQGMGVMSLKLANGKWERTNLKEDRRITGISGLEDGRYLKATGPAVKVFEKKDKLGYDDGLGSKIIGTMQNCAGGTTPWGTVLSAEENFQDQVPEGVMGDGSSLEPSARGFLMADDDIYGRGNVFGLAGNKYGWMVEIDPANLEDYGTKHTWLGRFRHEAVAFRAVEGKPLAVYSGCDRRGGHLYKFVSTEKVKDLKDKNNSQLMTEGMLYGAKFFSDGTGKWIALSPDTPVDPVLPSQVEGKETGMVPLPSMDRQVGGFVEMTQDEEMKAYKEKFKTLGDLYLGNSLAEKQGAILVDAHFAANAAGVTCTARPEDTEVDKDGKLYITFTSGTPGGDGGPDKAIFTGPQGQTPYEFGWIMRLEEDNNDPASMTFRWELFAPGGTMEEGGLGFSNPDNLEIDAQGNLWMVTDMSSSSHNQAMPSRTKDGKPVSQKDLLGCFGNNSIWYIPLSGPNAGQAYPFGVGPMDTETTGLFFTPDQKTLFLSIQHPGEVNGIRQNMATEEREFALLTTQGKEFMQKRQVPMGSNWPTLTENAPPLPAVVAIRRLNGEAIT